jgi:hypothetical protein
MKALQSAFEGLMISIGEIIATGFTPFIKVLTSVVQGIERNARTIEGRRCA